MSESLKTKTINGTLWNAIERFSVQGIAFVVMLIMARVLTPEDYGLVGMLAIFIAVSQSLVDSGFSQSLIRKNDRSEVDNSTTFYSNIIISILLYVVLFFSAPLIANFYEEPQLVILTRVIGLGVVFNAFAIVQRALFTIAIDFKAQAKTALTATVISGLLGIFLAYNGAGVWAIVWYQLANLAISTIMLWVQSTWRPKFLFSLSSFKNLFSFGSKLALSGIINTIYNNIYIVVIGKLFRPTDLGYYTRAHQFADFPATSMTSILQRVTYPVLCTIQDDDKRLRMIYQKFIRLSGLIVFPVLIGLGVLSEPLVTLVLTEKWLYTATIIPVLCLAMMWYPIHAINLNLLQVKGRSDLFLKLEILKKIIGVIILCTTYPFGIMAMCWGMVVSSIIALIINTHYTGKYVELGFFKQIVDLLPALFLSLTMGGAVWFVTILLPTDLLKLGIGTLVGVVYYIAVSFLLCPQDIHEIMALFRFKQ